MIGLYFKEGIKWIEWESRYDYLVTRFGVWYYYGKVPEGAKDSYLTDEGVNLTRVFMKQLYSGDFYLRINKVRDILQTYYEFQISLDSKNWYSTTWNLSRRKYIEAYWFKHIVEGVFRHYIGEGEAIAGVLLEGCKIKVTNQGSGVWVDIDISGTYLPFAIWKIRSVMKGRKWIESVTWGNRDIVEVNGERVIEK